MQNSMWMFTFSVFFQKLKIVILSLNFIHFSVFDLKYPFWATLVQKSKIVSLSWNTVQILIIWICRIWRWFSYLFCLRPEIPCLCKFGPKDLNSQFELKLRAYNHFHNCNWNDARLLLIKCYLLLLLILDPCTLCRIYIQHVGYID